MSLKRQAVTKTIQRQINNQAQDEASSFLNTLNWAGQVSKAPTLLRVQREPQEGMRHTHTPVCDQHTLGLLDAMSCLLGTV